MAILTYKLFSSVFKIEHCPGSSTVMFVLKENILSKSSCNELCS